jgi:NAD(P)-dependent dehydrogenase (short-subunit alcohol dehydrogenase family)
LDLGLRDRSAVVTGGAAGIGRETARYLAREGAHLLIADRDAEAVAATVEEIRGGGVRCEGFVLDVRRFEECEGMVRAAGDAFGAVDVLVTAAGVNLERFFLETRPEEWTDLLDVNLRGVMNACHCAGRVMAEQRRGSIVTIASEAGKLGEKRMVVYAASKGGVIGFTKALATEMGRYGVRVNAVCPGVTRTAMTAHYPAEQLERAASFYPLGRLGEPADTAALITFLASEQASWMTGQAVSVSGGFGRS